MTRKGEWTLGIFLAMVVLVMCGSEAAEEPLTVALFDLQAKDEKLQETGSMMRSLAESHLSTNQDLRMVSRVDIERIIEEQQLGLAGITDQAAPQVGSLLGAQVLVLGRVFVINEELYAAFRIIGTETSRTYGEVVKGDPSDLPKLGEEMAEKIAQLIEKGRSTLVAEVQLSGDQIEELKKKIGKKDLPRVFVHLREETIGAATIDPAAQTELEYIFIKSGFEVVKDRTGALKRWVEGYLAEGGKQAPPAVGSVDLILVGEGFSEFAARTGDLISCRARVELEALDPRSGRVLTVDRETVVAVDLSERIAAKSALEKAAAQLAFRILPEAVALWRAAEPSR